MRPRQPSPLPAALGVALLVFGGTVVAMVQSGPLDPRIALAGLAAAAALTVALVIMIWARHRAEAPLPRGRDRGAAPDDGTGTQGTVIVPLGHGEAAVIFDEPAAATPPCPVAVPAAVRREASRTADAIWDAVDAAVTEAGPRAPDA